MKLALFLLSVLVKGEPFWILSVLVRGRNFNKSDFLIMRTAAHVLIIPPDTGAFFPNGLIQMGPALRLFGIQVIGSSHMALSRQNREIR